VDLDAPAAERLAAVPAEMFARAAAVLADMRARAPRGAAALVPLLATLLDARTRGRFRDELKQAAARAGVGWRQLLLANASYDLAMLRLGCSTLALPTADGPVLARNMDWWPADKLAAASCVLRYRRGGRMRFALAGWPGLVGAVTGLSDRGFAVALNAVLSRDRCRPTGWPVLLHLRRVLEDAADFDQAVAMLAAPTLVAPALFTVVGSANDQRVCVERAPARTAVRRARGDEPLVTTNHYRALPSAGRRLLSDRAAELFESTARRCEALERLARRLQAAGNTTADGLLGALADEAVAQESTAQHALLRPSRGRIDLYVPRRLIG